MNMIDINSKTFDIFGKKSIDIRHMNSKLFDGISILNNDEFVIYCLKILDGHISDINKLKLSYLIQNLIQRGYDDTINTIITIFDIYINNVVVDLQNKLDCGNFTPCYFLDKFDEVYNRTFVLTKYLNRLDRSIKSEDKTNYSIIKTIRSYMFYRYVVCRMFKYNNSELHIYEIVSQMIQETEKIDEIVRLFKIVQHYNKLSFFVKTEKEKYFDMELNNKFALKVNGQSNKFLELLSNRMNDDIKSLLKTSDIKNAEQKLDEIRDLIKLGLSLVEDKSVFMLMYRANLTDRLLNGNTNAEIEDELLTSLTYFDNPEIYTKMKYQINDVKSSKLYNENYKKIIVEPRTEKYKNYDMTKLNKNITNFMVARSYAWDLKEDETLNIPAEISIYFDIFNAYYKQKYQDRELNCQFDKSTTVARIELSGQYYNIHMTLPQLIVLTTINNACTISAKNISVQLDMPLRKLGPILNSLIAVKLINREDGPSNNPNLLFTINNNCTFPEEHVSLISLMRKKNDNELSDIMLKAEIFSYLAQSEGDVLENIIKYLEEKYKIKLDSTRVSNILSSQEKMNMIKMNNNEYMINDNYKST